MALTYFSYISHRWVHPVSKVYLLVNDKQFTLVSCFNHQPLATLCYGVTLLYSRWVSPSHERASDQSRSSWGGTEATALAQQLVLIAQPFRATEWDEHVHRSVRRQRHMLLTRANVTRTNVSKATFTEQCVGKWLLFYSVFTIKVKLNFVKSTGVSVRVSDVTADYFLINRAYLFTLWSKPAWLVKSFW